MKLGIKPWEGAARRGKYKVVSKIVVAATKSSNSLLKFIKGKFETVAAKYVQKIVRQLLLFNSVLADIPLVPDVFWILTLYTIYKSFQTIKLT